MTDQGELYEKSWILYHVLDRFIGSREMVAVRRSRTLLHERITEGWKMPILLFETGSCAEGFEMKGSDWDIMIIDNRVLVLCPDQKARIPQESLNKAVLKMRDAHSRPGYVRLEVVKRGQTCPKYFQDASVAAGDVYFISSEMCRRTFQDVLNVMPHKGMEINGPASTYLHKNSNLGVDQDRVISFPCSRWPKEANEWVSRLRLHDWPNEPLRAEIVKAGCHLVPVGDKMSDDTFLQWRISFAAAERKLVHSFTHSQFLVYGLLKYFLKQISGELKTIMGDVDIISSYIIKTAIFYTVENTPQSLWQEKNTFLCFMLCLKMLMTWVNAGHCPNYFINRNNMFLGKLQGGTKRKLFCYLIGLYNRTWNSLSVGTFIKPTIGDRINSVRNGAWGCVLPSPTQLERELDMTIFTETIIPGALPVTLKLLSKTKSDLEAFVTYFVTVKNLAHIGMQTFEKHASSRGNKEKYKSLRKCKNLLNPLATACTSPGLLTLATYHYQTGNYKKTLEICEHMISSWKIYVDDGTRYKGKDSYEQMYCGHGHTLLHKYREACVSRVTINNTYFHFCPSQLHMELAIILGRGELSIPPLPYALFLSFLCYHELGDAKRHARDTALHNLRAVKHAEEQGGDQHWIVHNLLGICYEMVGDKKRVLREYKCSPGGRRHEQHKNPAKERIERLQHSQQRKL